MHLIAKQLNAKWGEGTVTLTIHDQYRNMSEVIQGCMHLIDNAVEAARLADIVPDVAPIRGGTDGCRLSYMDFLVRTLEPEATAITDHMNISPPKAWILPQI